ncbi:wall-associated receptor kinase-like 10 [Alnus glutinosa]|uniref:wall-associated receptor kinase-like 10 n=1 Tax=Alnus glutinosa TaxID=3517 RepID=UPI002D79585F|nr:wall-associated receptor kinase-like 10 [Alnus glutinosa]
MAVKMVFQIMIVLLCSIDAILFVQAAGLAINSTSCQAICGDVSIPYPFGIGAGCYVDHWFEVVCNDSFSPPKPFLSSFGLEVLNISLGDAYRSSRSTVRVNYPTFSTCTNSSSRKQNVELANSSFIFSQGKNIFVVMGCDNSASMRSSDGSIIGCMQSRCDSSKVVINGSSCHGTNCCQTTIASDLNAFETTIDPISYPAVTKQCNSAFLVEEEWFWDSGSLINMSSIMSHVPVVLEWGIFDTSFYSLPISLESYTNKEYDCYGHGGPRAAYFTCYCNWGFKGNPYVVGGCGDINECEEPGRVTYCSNNGYCVNTYGSYKCGIDTKRLLTIGISSSFGLLVLLVGGWWSYKVVKKRRRIKQKNKFFKRNGGLLLQQQLSSHEANFENTKLFNSKDLEKATDRFNVNRILGQGGQGIVYKGMLTDGRIVAVKKSKVIDEGKLEEFINEVFILSQINHRNVVKLIGCCLETEVPLLVYEYVPNGALSQYVNGQTEEFPLTWDMRLRIATEVAGALFYLHSVASLPIYHRDIKSTNILLDDKFRAKVADFGISRNITVDQTHLTTLVHGTFGYLDPEYFQSSQFTEKSDVYSFGVVLAELLTGKKVISSTRTQESKSLATYFIQSVEENNLFDIIDSRVLKEGKREEIIAIANLANRCLNLNGKKRPTMKEVAIELDVVQMLQKAPNLQQNYEELEDVQAKMYEPPDVVPTSTMSTLFVDAQPLLSFQSV